MFKFRHDIILLYTTKFYGYLHNVVVKFIHSHADMCGDIQNIIQLI